MPTPHNRAQVGDYAKTCLMPGDPLRAQYIAKNFLDNVKLVNDVRNCLGYTGTFEGKPVSVQASGMGIPSLSIYATELATIYGVESIIRVGSAGSLSPNLKVRDIVLAEGSCTDSAVVSRSFAHNIHFAPIADFSLLKSAWSISQDLGLSVHVGNVFAADRFYDEETDNQKLADYGILAVEMETAGLYLLGAKLHFKALAALSVSNMILGEGEELTSEERQTTLDDLITLGLKTATHA